MTNPASTPESVSEPLVAIIDYRLGNVRSVANAIEAIGARATITNDPDVLRSADRLILPGVGAFEDGMNNLRTLGLEDFLTGLVLGEGKPILGICLGMQLLAKTGYENGKHAGLGWIEADVIRFNFENTSFEPLKIPHVGWNDVRFINQTALSTEHDVPHSFYFVHSYYLDCADTSDVAGVCNYGVDFTAAVQRGNVTGVQFHPEKSQKHGLALLKNFVGAASVSSVIASPEGAWQSPAQEHRSSQEIAASSLRASSQ